MDKVLRNQQSLLEEEANCLQIIIDQLQPLARDEGAMHSGEGESLQVVEVLGKHMPSPGKGQKRQQSPTSRQMTEKKQKWRVTQSKTNLGRRGHDGRKQPLRREQTLLKMGTEEGRGTELDKCQDK